MCATRYRMRTAPVTAMTNFSCTEDTLGGQRTGAQLPAGSPTVTTGHARYCAAADKARNPTDSHHHDLICRGWSYASPSALRRGDANCASLFPPSRVRHPRPYVRASLGPGRGANAVESATAGAAAHSGRAAMRHDRCVRAFGPARAYLSDFLINNSGGPAAARLRPRRPARRPRAHSRGAGRRGRGHCPAPRLEAHRRHRHVIRAEADAARADRLTAPRVLLRRLPRRATSRHTRWIGRARVRIVHTDQPAPAVAARSIRLPRGSTWQRTTRDTAQLNLSTSVPIPAGTCPAGGPSPPMGRGLPTDPRRCNGYNDASSACLSAVPSGRRVRHRRRRRRPRSGGRHRGARAGDLRGPRARGDDVPVGGELAPRPHHQPARRRGAARPRAGGGGHASTPRRGIRWATPCSPRAWPARRSSGCRPGAPATSGSATTCRAARARCSTSRSR